MSWSAVIAAALGVLASALLLRFAEGHAGRGRGESSAPPHDPMAEALFAGARAGAEHRRAIRVYSYADLVVLRSLLWSCAIPSWALFTHMGVLRTGAAVPHLNSMELIVLAEDLPAVRSILGQYLDQRRQRRRPIPRVVRLRAIVEALLGWVIPPGGHERLPELHPGGADDAPPRRDLPSTERGS